MKVVILAGGLGTRLSEETTTRPKPMAEIGEKPMLWHIMKMYSHYGFNEFVICLGYKGYMIKEYFSNYFLHNCDVTFDMRTNETVRAPERERALEGDAGRHRRRDHDGRPRQAYPAVRRRASASCSRTATGWPTWTSRPWSISTTTHGKLATLTAVQPLGRFGALDVEDDAVMSFREKPLGDGDWINGGFMVLEPEVFDRIEGDATILEQEPLQSLAR